MRRTNERRKIIKKLDTVFSKIIRTRDKWTCFRCGAVFAPPTTSLQNSHFWPREIMATRYHPDNCDAACYGCHFFHLEKQKQGVYRTYKLQQLGQQRYDALESLATAREKLTTAQLQEMCESMTGKVQLKKVEPLSKKFQTRRKT